MVLKSTNIRNTGGAGPVSIMSNSNHFLGANMMRDLSRGLSDGHYDGAMGMDHRGGGMMDGGQSVMSGDSSQTSLTSSTAHEGHFSSSRRSSNDLGSSTNTITSPISPMDTSYPIHPVYLNVVSPTSFTPNYYYPGQSLNHTVMPPPLPFQYKQERTDSYQYHPQEMGSSARGMQQQQQHDEFNHGHAFNNGNYTLESTSDPSSLPYLNHSFASSSPLISPQSQSQFRQQQQQQFQPKIEYQDSLHHLDGNNSIFNKSQATYASLEQGMHNSWSR